MLGTVVGAEGSDRPGRHGPYLPGAHGPPNPRVGEVDRHWSKNIILSDKYTKPRDTAGTAVRRVGRSLHVREDYSGGLLEGGGLELGHECPER